MKATAIAVILCLTAPVKAEETLPRLALYKSYMSAVKNSAGSRFFRNLYYVEKDGRVPEVLQNGNLSCAYFVSTILRHFDLIGKWRVGVDEVVEEMKRYGWTAVVTPRPGDVIVWGKKCFKKSKKCHKHVGFIIGKGRAVSNSSGRKYPAIHGLRPDGRKIEGYFRHQRLEEEK